MKPEDPAGLAVELNRRLLRQDLLIVASIAALVLAVSLVAAVNRQINSDDWAAQFQLVLSRNPKHSVGAQKALQHPDAIPFLLSKLAEPHDGAEQNTTRRWAASCLRQALESRKLETTRYRELTKRERERFDRWVERLPWILLSMADDPEVNVRWFCVRALGHIGTAAEEAIPDLINILNGQDPEFSGVRCAAVQSLVELSGRTEETAELLAGVLPKADDRVRKEILRTLGRFGPQARSAIPAIREVALTDARHPALAHWAINEIENTPVPGKGDAAPDFTFYDVDSGKPQRLSDFRGQIVYLEFWRDINEPHGIPFGRAERSARRNASDWAGRVVLLGISTDEGLYQLRSRLKQNQWPHVKQNWVGEDKEGQLVYRTGMNDRALLIDSTGTIVWRGDPTTLDLEQAIANAQTTANQEPGPTER